LSPEEAKELGIEMRTGADKPTLDAEYEVITLQHCLLLWISNTDISTLHVVAYSV